MHFLNDWHNMNYADYIRQKTAEIEKKLKDDQRAKGKPELGFSRENEYVIVTMPASEIEPNKRVSVKDVVCIIIECEMRVDVEKSLPEKPGPLSDFIGRSPYYISAGMILGSAPNGLKAMVITGIPLAISFILTNAVTTRLDRRQAMVLHEKERRLSHIMGHATASGTAELERLEFTGTLAKRITREVDTLTKDLDAGRDGYIKLLKLRLGNRRNRNNAADSIDL